MLELSRTLQSVWWTFTSSAEPVRFLAVQPDLQVQRFAPYNVWHRKWGPVQMIQHWRILVASDISTSKSEIGRSDWASVRTKLIKLYNKFDMVTDCSFMKLPVEGNGTDDLAYDKVNLRIAFAV